MIVESLTTAERISMEPQMLGSMVQLGRVYTLTDRKRQAVEILANVDKEPSAEMQLFTEPEPIGAQARSQLKELAAEMDPDDFEASRASMDHSRSRPRRGLDRGTLARHLTEDEMRVGSMPTSTWLDLPEPDNSPWPRAGEESQRQAKTRESPGGTCS